MIDWCDMNRDSSPAISGSGEPVSPESAAAGLAARRRMRRLALENRLKAQLRSRLANLLHDAEDGDLVDARAFADRMMRTSVSIQRIEVAHKRAPRRGVYYVDFGSSWDLLDFASAAGEIDTRAFRVVGSGVEFTARSAFEREQLTARLMRYVDAQNATIDSWVQENLSSTIALAASQESSRRGSVDAQRASDEDAGWNVEY